MEIKLPHMPFRFESPDGRMEVTVRRGVEQGGSGRQPPFVAGLAFLQAGPRALERIPLAVKADSHTEALRLLTVAGFKVNPSAHDEFSTEFRVLSALCQARGVIDLNP